MKTFFASLLAGYAVASVNKREWTGAAATVGSNEMTPSAETHWSGTATELSVTWQQKLTMTTDFAAAGDNGDYGQSWTCIVDGEFTDCLFWQFWLKTSTTHSLKFRHF